jgi:Fe-S oxidoreductase/nitrate reductase gamma subunit
MNFTREIYWNVGHGVLLPMYLFAAITVAILIYGFIKRIRVYRQGKPLQRLDQLPRRILRLVERGLAQLRVMIVKAPGITHAFQFWGMILLFIGTALITIQVDFAQPLFGQVNGDFLKGTFYLIFSITLDIAGAVVIVALCGFLVRRFIYKPKGLATTRDDFIIYGLLIAILLTAYVIEGARMAVTELNQNPYLAGFSPVGLLVARLLSGMSESSLRGLHIVMWWIHFFLAMGLIAAIPFTKFRHLLTTPLNYLFADLKEKGSIETINLEAADADHFGVSVLGDLTWKDIFDADACTACKRCQDRCPAWTTDKPLSPMKVIQQIGEVAFINPEANLIDTVAKDVIWACTTCYACQEICPADIEHVNKILEMRRYLVLMQGEFPGGEVMSAVNNTEVNGNPFGLAYATRGDWANGLEVQRTGGSPVDILYFAGCYASFDKRNQDVARNFIKICNAAGVKVGILGKDEKCCGEPVRKWGNEYLYQTVATENIKKIKAFGASRIVTTCPHCFNTLSRDYRDLGLDLEVEHYATFLDRLISRGSLHLKPQSFDCTYHDSCYLGRYKDIVSEPRNVLRAAGGRITEMTKTGSNGFCCGGGGGRVLAEEKLGRRINVERVKMAQATGSPLLVSNCPFCLTMFEDGIKTGGSEGKLQVRDLSEVIVERISQ